MMCTYNAGVHSSNKEPKYSVKNTAVLISHRCNASNGKAIYSIYMIILKPEGSLYPETKAHCQTFEPAQSNQIITIF
jgi:hypothetical protein